MTPLVSRHEPIFLEVAWATWKDWATHKIFTKPTSIRATHSAVMTTIRHVCDLTNQDWHTLDLRPILFDLPTYALSAHAHTESPGDASGRVKKWIDQLLAREGDSKVGRAEPFLPPVYRPLLPTGHRGIASILLVLQRAAHTVGWTEAPAKWPAAELLHQGAAVLNIGKKSVSQACRDYRDAVDRLRATNPDAARSFGDIPYLPHNMARHVGVALGMSESKNEALKLAAPELYADVMAYLHEEGSPGLKKSEAWRKLALEATARLAGSLARAGFKDRLITLSYPDVWKPTEVRPAKAGGAVSRARASLKLNADDDVKISPLRLALDADKLESNRVSPASPQGGYNQSAMHEAQIAWTILEGVYGNALRAQKPTEFAELKASWDTLRKHINENRATSQHPKDKQLAVETLNYAQIIVIGLPLLRRYVRSLLDQADAAAEFATQKGHTPSEHPAVKKAYRKAYVWLERYLVVALVTDDGLRLKQYVRGCWGQNITADWRRDASGTIIGIARVRTHWSGDRSNPAPLKIQFTSKTTQHLSDRSRTVRPGVMDYDLLWRYLRDVRHPVIKANPPTARRKGRRGGVVNSPTIRGDFDPIKDADAKLPLFFSKSGHGSYTEGVLSGDRFGRALHWIAVHAMGRDIPAWGELGKEWRALWAAHIARLHIASYWMLVRPTDGGVVMATHLTMDKAETLQKYYAQFNKLYLDAPKDGSPEDPAVYDGWIDRLIRNHDAADPLMDSSIPLPEAARTFLESLDRALPRAPVRKARPGQRPPGGQRLKLVAF